MKKMKLDARLLAVASLVRKGAYLADVGTDHAYLPVYLAECGRISGAVASDIHKGPLISADKNIREAGFSDRIQTLLTDGLQGIEKYPITDIAIAGMGGLMIRNILEKAHFLRREQTPHLILQPMQHIPELRRYLGEQGFSVQEEKQALAEGKFYQIILAVYDGTVREYTETELLLGKYNIEHKKENKENFLILCERQLEILREKIEGLEKGGRSAEKERALYASIEEERKDL
ncbi:MAG: SAM-dependent methyltransferase [Clostridia bacterium]|nr:SAM-dependent methyltransferase [Clostridia bacterium]